MLRKCLTILPLLLLGAFADESHVLELTDETFESELARHENTLVMFYAPWWETNSRRTSRDRDDYRNHSALTCRSCVMLCFLCSINIVDPSLCILRGSESSRTIIWMINYEERQTGKPWKSAESADGRSEISRSLISRNLSLQLRLYRTVADCLGLTPF